MSRPTSNKISVGNQALSAFRLAKLRAALKEVAPDITIEDTRYWYFTELKAPLSDTENTLLDRLLNLDTGSKQNCSGVAEIIGRATSGHDITVVFQSNRHCSTLRFAGCGPH